MRSANPNGRRPEGRRPSSVRGIPVPSRVGHVDMNAHALAVLEFPLVLERVADRAFSESGREAIRVLEPVTSPEAASRELDRVVEVMRVLASRPEWAPPSFPEADTLLGTLRVEGAVLDPGGVRTLIDLLTATRGLAAALAEVVRSPPQDGVEGGAVENLPHLDGLLAQLPIREELERRMERIVDETGQVRDGASATLRSTRSQMRVLRGRVVKRLEALLSALPERHRLEDASVSVREGRYVIPIRREARAEVGGVVYGESATGATLFVEPPLAMQLRSELNELERAESTEILRILRSATSQFREVREAMAAGFRALVDFDTLQARARTAVAWKAHPPELLPPGAGPLTVVGGRHPLLLEQGVEVVPFNLHLGDDERAVVVSGPNTGGKTVLLKTVGLVHLLAQSGVLPPVREGTRLPVLEDLFADVGDEQSLSASLSTFSAHLSNAKEILAAADSGTLVLIDEMGTGTDPSEGAALARALLETLVAQGARVLATSHLGALKRLDVAGSGIINASLLFDSERVTPTYQLRKGRPGRSYGLAIARGLGLPSSLVDLAEGYVDSGELRLEGLLEGLEARESELTQALLEAESSRSAAAQILRESELRRARMAERESQLEERAREEARRLLMAAREEVEATIRELRSAGAPESGSAEGEARARVEAAARAMREGDRRARPSRAAHSRSSVRQEPKGHPWGSATLSEGDPVRLRDTGGLGVVRAIGDGRVSVEVGALRMDLPEEAVERAEEAKVGSRSPRSGAERTRVGEARASIPTWSGAEVDIRTEADLRGLRVEEVELALGRALDGAVVGSLAELRIIHGLGTGAVKARVRELLRDDPRVERVRPGGEGEGGAGVTVAVLR